MVGKVAQKFDIEVGRAAGGGTSAEGGDVIDPEYRALSRLRARAAASKTRTTQLISQPQITDLRQPVYIGSKKKVRATASVTDLTGGPDGGTQRGSRFGRAPCLPLCEVQLLGLCLVSCMSWLDIP